MRKLQFFLCLCYGFLLMGQDVPNFDKPTISIGLVASDMEASYAFYTEVIGLQEVGAFTVDSTFSKRSGLSGGVAFDVKILKVENSETASELKLVSFQKEGSGKDRYIQEQNGMRYMTLFVNTMDAISERIKESGIPLLSEPGLTIGDGRKFVLIQDPDGVFVELIGN